MRIELQIHMEGLPPVGERLLSRLGTACLLAEGLPEKCQTGLIITDDEGIEEINRVQRGIASPTDVLSFPSAEYPRGETAGHHIRLLRREMDVETGCIHLGDIVISLPHAAEQARKYGHSFLREVGFLYVHGVLHLMGYDHETEAQRAAMRAMEDMIMEKTGLSRDLTDADLELLDGAREAMRMA
ncbi:rRNA maturation RNase YbeY, partial [Eubacteriales bacterium OttesenSCG-928-A19]|nr:rRNA maturation RNase YbeY [Eubacteriales bacterium OttesenSCG-928-A19]